jgi:hypothetical protein
MKLTDPAKETLLDDLMLEREGAAGAYDPGEIFAIVRGERTRRWQQRRRCALGAAGACLLLLMMSVGNFYVSRQATTTQPGNTARGSHIGDASLPQTAGPSPVERLDDEGLLDLLDTTPSALVQWPDGRRSLLLVVGEASAGAR